MDDILLQEVQIGIRSRKGEWKRMAAQIPGVSYSWIAQVGRGKYNSAPSYQRLQAVAAYLRANPREHTAA
jgi:hypothetical protein